MTGLSRKSFPNFILALLKYSQFSNREYAAHKLAVCALAALVTGCAPKPQIVKEPYPVEVVREVYREIPAEYTDQLQTPQLPEGEVTCQDLSIGWGEWQAWGKTVNEHRAKVNQLSAGSE
jgi:hypothetical protein